MSSSPTGCTDSFVRGHCRARNPLRQIVALDEFHHERVCATTDAMAAQIADGFAATQ
jgi:hypothetical protein